MSEIRTEAPVSWPASRCHVGFVPHDASCEEWHSPGLLAQVLEAVPTAIYTTDAQGRITFYNPAAIKLWGCSPELGRSEFCGSWRLFWPDGVPLPHDECPMAVVLRTGEPKSAEAMAERPDGSKVAFLAYPTPLWNTSRELIGAVNTLIDITERKREEALRDCQRQALHLLAQGAPLEDLLEYLIEVMERHADAGMLGSILLLDESGNRFQRGIGKRLPAAVNAAVEGVAVSSLIGVFCHAIANRETIVVSDFDSDPKWAALAEFLNPLGFAPAGPHPFSGRVAQY